MNAKEQAVAILKNGEQYARGFWDGLADLENKRINRAILNVGELFCLPKNNKGYCIGYCAGRYFERSRADIEIAVHELIQERTSKKISMMFGAKQIKTHLPVTAIVRQ